MAFSVVDLRSIPKPVGDRLGVAIDDVNPVRKVPRVELHADDVLVPVEVFVGRFEVIAKGGVVASLRIKNKTIQKR